jgi:RNA polymerase sigma-70 factor (ECF subfamily)
MTEIKNQNTELERVFIEKTGKPFHSQWNLYYDKLIYFLNKYCMDIQLAEDMAVDSFLMSLQKIDQYDKDKSQFSTWLFTIGRNHTIQTIKKLKIQLHSSIDTPIDDEGSTIKDFLPFEEYDKDVELVSKKKADIMRNHIDQLNEPYRQVMQMREVDRLPYKDIAEILDRNLSTVKSQIRNGRNILIKNTEEEFKQLDVLYGLN